MIDGVDNTVLYGVAGAGLFVLIVAISTISLYLNRQRAVSDERQVYKLRRKRVARYEDAKKDYEKFRKKIESGNTVLIDLIHDLGDDFVGRDSAQQQIAFDEAFEAVASIRQANPRARIIVVLHTLGGYARPAHMISLALKQHLAKARAKGHYNPKREPQVIAYVPYVAMSGGTMIALAADKIVMDPTASLGPIDTIYGGFPTEAYKELLAQKGPLATQDVLVMLAHEAEKYDRYAGKVARDIVNPVHRVDEKVEHHIADTLSAGTLSHSQAITPEDAKALGMNVKTKIPDLIYGLVDARIRMIHTRLEFEARRMEDEDGPGDGKGDEAEQAVGMAIERAIRQSLRGNVRL
ncbi:SDH family Clp fold serine proteinase [Maricaulis sp.]|uniref:SDH family Clp fold serine proteinase n=1 Tax=Maricaulis sp. TaxID=1486257 RepID=UPI002B26AADE|nr:hypothetical protein [Maricaulis sp.]